MTTARVRGVANVEYNEEARKRLDEHKAAKKVADVAVDQLTPGIEKICTSGVVSCLKASICVGGGAVVASVNACSSVITPSASLALTVPIAASTKCLSNLVTPECVQPLVHCSVGKSTEIAKKLIHASIDSSCCSSSTSSCSTKSCCS